MATLSDLKLVIESQTKALSALRAEQKRWNRRGETKKNDGWRRRGRTTKRGECVIFRSDYTHFES